MRLVELECQNCGAALKIDEGTNIVHCPYCNAKYKIDDEVKHVKYDDMENSGYEFEKGRIKAQKENMASSNTGNASKIIAFILAAFVIVLVVFSIVVGVTGTKFFKTTKTKYTSQQVFSFNMYYSSGNKAAVFVKSMLDHVVESNGKNKDKMITVTYKDVTTTEENKILEIEKELDTFGNYDVLLEYDDDGFVNVIKIK